MEVSQLNLPSLQPPATRMCPYLNRCSNLIPCPLAIENSWLMVEAPTTTGLKQSDQEQAS